MNRSKIEIVRSYNSVSNIKKIWIRSEFNLRILFLTLKIKIIYIIVCTVCQKQESFVGNVLVRCEGCPKAFHQKCFSSQITDETVSSEEQWFCEGGCSDNVRRKRIGKYFNFLNVIKSILIF